MVRRGLLVSVHMHLCTCVHLYQWGEGMLRFVSIVKAPQVSCAHRHCRSLIKEGPTSSMHGSDWRCA